MVDNIAVDERGGPGGWSKTMMNGISTRFFATARASLAIDGPEAVWTSSSCYVGLVFGHPRPNGLVKVDSDQAPPWEDGRRDALLECLHQWRNGPEVKYNNGHRMDYRFECRGDEAARRVRAKLGELGLQWEPWGPQPE